MTSSEYYRSNNVDELQKIECKVKIDKMEEEERVPKYLRQLRVVNGRFTNIYDDRHNW